MVTLHLLKLLEDEGFGTIDSDLFWENVPVNNSGDPIEGIWILPRAASVDRFFVEVQPFDIYARYRNKITSSQKLENILEYLREAFADVCELPTLPESDNLYTNVRIVPTSSIENVGTDEQGMMVRLISGEIRFNKEQ